MSRLDRIRRRLLWGESEAGTSLMLALLLITVISVALVALLSYAATSLHTVGVVREQRGTSYAADAAVETAIATMRTADNSGHDGEANGSACPSTSYASTGTSPNVQPSVSVSCKIVQSHAAITTGGSSDLPAYEVLALGHSASESGIVIGSGASTGKTVTVGGAVASNSPAVASTYSINASSKLDATGYSVTATGSCFNVVTAIPSDLQCDTGTTVADPGYPSQASQIPAKYNPTPTCAASNATLQFEAGYYTDVSMFNSPTYTQGGHTCTSGYLYFKPGAYYFDFCYGASSCTSSNTTWSIPNGVMVVGGQPKGWNPDTGIPNKNLTADGYSIWCKTSLDGATDGVQFILGGSSQITTSAGTTELCPNPNPTGTTQQITLYGYGGTDQTSAATATLLPTSSTTSVTNPNATFSNAPGLLTIDCANGAPSTCDSNAANVALSNTGAGSNKNGIGKWTLSGFNQTTIPTGSVIGTVTLKVSHRATATPSSNLASLSAVITPGTGSACAAISVPVNVATTYTTASLSVPSSCLNTASQFSGLTIAYTATDNTGNSVNSTEFLDGISLDVTYTKPNLRPQVAALTTPGNTTAALNIDKTNTTFITWGTIYLPQNLVNAAFYNNTAGGTILYVHFRRGIIMRSINITIVPPGGDVNSFCLGFGNPCAGSSRILLLSATPSGDSSPALEALVEYTDTPALGRTVQVLSWNTIRGG